MSIYQPIGSVTAESIVTPQIRLLLIGAPGSGKTSAACSFPNPVILDLDSSTTSVKQICPHAFVLPFHDPEWLLKTVRTNSVCHAVKGWLASEGLKLTGEQTLVIDSLSAFQDYFHSEHEPLTPTGKDGNPNPFWLWGRKAEYFGQLFNGLAKLKCHVVCTIHKKEIRDDKTGMLTGKISHLFTGSTGDQLGRFFTDVFFQLCEDKKDAANKVIGTTYKWQIRGSNLLDLKTRMRFDVPQFVDANFNSIKY